MTRIYKTPFAATGDREALADLDPGTGKVSLPSGWTPDYEKENDDPNYRPVGRQELNGILHEITASLGEMQIYGVATWRPLVGGWPAGARVAQTGGIGAWYNTVEGNTSDPNDGGTGWIEIAGLLVLPSAPSTELSKLIYVLDRRQFLTWQTIGTYTGYASAEVGDFRWGTSITPKPGTDLLIGQTVDRSLPRYAALGAWAEVNGHMVPSGSWTKGAFHFSMLSGNNMRMPDIRDMFIRATGTDADTANARALGSRQDDSFRNHSHNYQKPVVSALLLAQGASTFGISINSNSILDTSLTGGSETRGANTALHPLITL